ncbi:hypothetical protein [Roseiarcus sp.]|uniref:hypothetical protein n=1 Tax=Roseiarcus sp. TaxID=1969460 RepID=UPI003F99EC39
MKQSLILGLVFAAALSLPALAGEETKAVHPHRHVYHHVHHSIGESGIAPNAAAQVPQPAPVLGFPSVAPYPNGQGDTDGLSRDINDCNKGCIGGNPG